MPSVVHYLLADDYSWRQSQQEYLEPEQLSNLAPIDLNFRFATSAEDGLIGLVVFGWHPEAISLIASDARLRQKRLVFICDRRYAGNIAIAANCSDLPLIQVMLLHDKTTLPAIFQSLPMVWSYAILDDRVASTREICHLIKNRFIRRSATVERLRKDLDHLRSRLPRIEKSIPLAAWRDQWPGCTALCIAAGPSLDGRFDFLRKHADHCIIIAVDVIASRLQAAGITIDFVINVDSDDVGSELFARSQDPHTTLIMPLSGHRNHDQRFSQVSYFGQGTLDHKYIGQDCRFAHGTNVGLATVGLAQFLGCREVVLLGHDLAYEDEAYYSSFAGGDKDFSKNEESTHSTNRVEVLGNCGSPVRSNHLFSLGIDDFALMLRFFPDLVVYNPNANDRIGAFLPLTKPLPENWAPNTNGTKKRPENNSRVIVDTDAPNAETVLTWLHDDAKILLKRWQELAASGHSIASGFIAHESHAENHPSETYLDFAFEAFVIHQLRSLRQPDLTTGHPMIVASSAGGLAALSMATDWITRFSEPASLTEIDPSLSAFLAQSWKVDHGNDDEIGVFYRSLEAVLLNRLWSMAPTAEGPEPLSAEDGLGLLALIGSRSPLSLVMSTLNWCALDQRAFRGPLDAARNCGLLKQNDLTALAEPRGGCAGAVESLLRLESGTQRDGDIQRAFAWHACQTRLLVHLLKNNPARALELLRSESIYLDDHTASLLVHHHGELTKATAFLADKSLKIGEATTLALAGRLIEAGNFENAIPLLQSIRPLSRFRKESLALQAESLLHLNRPVDALRCALSISDPLLARPYVLKSGCLSGSWQIVAETLHDDCPPTLLAMVLSNAWRAKQRAILERVRDIASAPANPAAEHPTIAQAAAKMLASLPSATT